MKTTTPKIVIFFLGALLFSEANAQVLRFYAQNSRYDEVGEYHDGLAIVSKTKPVYETQTSREKGYASTEGQTITTYTRYLVGHKTKYGFINKSGKLVVSIKYDQVKNFSGGFAAVRKGKDWGIIDTKGKTVVSLKYDEVTFFSEGLMAVRDKNKWGFVNTSGKVVIPLQYDDALFYNEGLAPVKLEMLWGYIDPNGQMAIKPRFWRPGLFSEGLAETNYKDGMRNLIDRTGKVVATAGPYDEKAILFSNGLAVVRLEDCYGYIDKTGKEIIPLKYFDATHFDESGFGTVKLGYEYYLINKEGKLFESKDGVLREYTHTTFDRLVKYSEGMAAFRKDCNWGYADESGKVVVPPIYNSTYFFKNGLALVGAYTDKKRTFGFKEKWGFIDKTGKEIIPVIYDAIFEFQDGITVFQKDEKWGVIRSNGEIVEQPIYMEAHEYSEGFARVKTGPKQHGFIDKTGKLAIPAKYYFANDFKEGLAAIMIEQTGVKGMFFPLRMGFVDKTGKEVIPPDYQMVRDFNHGLARVKARNSWGLIDNKGKTVLSIKYDDIDYFSDGMAKVYKKEKVGFVNTDGKITVPVKYDTAGDFYGDVAIVERKGKLGFVDKRGKEVVPVIYDSLCLFSEGLAAVEKDGKVGFVDSTGKVVLPLIYDSATDFKDGKSVVILNDQRKTINKAGEEVQ